MKCTVGRIINALLLALMPGLFFSSEAALTQAFKDATDKAIDSVRRSDCEISFQFKGNDVIDTGITVSAKLIRHHFGFGGAICWDSGFVKVGKEKYGNAVKEYFEWCTPENEMKWY